MSSEPQSVEQLAIEICKELRTWLHNQNAPKRLSLFDRPFVLTILGGVVGGLLTTWWQTSASRREAELSYQRAIATEQISLLKEVDATFEDTGQTLNGWFARVICIAQETNKPETEQTKKNITQWKDETRKLEQQLSTAPPFDNVLLRVDVLYHCQSVKAEALEMRRTWESFNEKFQLFSQDWNEKQKLPSPDIDSAETVRKSLLASLEKQDEHLTATMGAEVAAARDNKSTCPP